MRRACAIAGLLVGCPSPVGPTASPVTPAPAQVAARPPVEPRAAEQAEPNTDRESPVVAAPAATVGASELPAFARPDVDLESEFPLRATIRTVGWVYESATGTDGVAGDGTSTMVPAIVIDDGAATNPRRVRVLCSTEHHRIAVFVDAGDLMTTVRDQVLMVAHGPMPKRVHDRTPGIRVEPGAPLLVVQRPTRGLAFVRYEGVHLDAEGFVPVGALDVVYAGERMQRGGRANAEVVRRARLHERPGGRPLGRIAPTSGPEDVRWVELLGPRAGKWRLVRYEEADVEAVGWIDREHLRVRAGDLPDPPVVAPAAGTPPARAFPLRRGTRFVAQHGDDVLGIVTDDTAAECVGDCSAATPLVRVESCTARVTVRALAPE